LSKLKQKSVHPKIERHYSTGKVLNEGGITLKEYYAGLFAQSLLAKGQTGESVTTWAIEYADELIEKLEKNGKG
jgi:hypothetical protein